MELKSCLFIYLRVQSHTHIMFYYLNGMVVYVFRTVIKNESACCKLRYQVYILKIVAVTRFWQRGVQKVHFLLLFVCIALDGECLHAYHS